MNYCSFSVEGWHYIQRLFGVYEPEDPSEFTAKRWLELQQQFKRAKWAKPGQKRSKNRVRTSSACAYRAYGSRDV